MAPLCLLLPIAVFAVLLDISLSSLAPGEGFDPERSGEVLGMGREILAMGSMQTIVALVLAGLATRVARKRAPAG